MAKTLAEKVWDAHVVRKGDGEGANAQPDLLYIDLHLVHEVTSPQAFKSLRRGDLMNEVQIDEEKVRLGVGSFAVALAHHVCVPDFLGQCLCHGHLPSLIFDC